MQLLQDVFIIENLQVLTEGAGKGPMKIKGVFGRCNEKNNNGRIYPTAVLESQLQKVQPLISERRLCGELDHPQNDTVKLSNASHLITKLEMKGDELIGEAEVLQTPAGLTAKALVEGGVKIGISSRGMGTLSEDHDGNKVVNEDFRLVTFDLVADPSTRGAFPGLSESTESKFIKESQSKLQKESNFVTMLESKMREAYQPWVDESRESKKTRAARERAEAKAAEEAKKEDAQANTDELRRSPQQTLKAEAFERVKAEGSYHRIAYTLADALGHEISERKKNLPGNQEAIDADGDGKIEASDLKKLRNRKKKVDEAFADELEKEGQRSLAAANPAADQGGMMANWRARRHAKGMEVAAAKGRVKGKSIEQKGEIKRAQRMANVKTKMAAAEAAPQTTSAPKKSSGGRMSAHDILDKQRSRRKIARVGQAQAGMRDSKPKFTNVQALPPKATGFGAGAAPRPDTGVGVLSPQERNRRLTKQESYKRLGNIIAEMFYLKESHPASAQSRMKKELGDEAYEKLSSRPNDPSPVEAARAKREASKKAASAKK